MRSWQHLAGAVHVELAKLCFLPGNDFDGGEILKVQVPVADELIAIGVGGSEVIASFEEEDRNVGVSLQQACGGARRPQAESCRCSRPCLLEPDRCGQHFAHIPSPESEIVASQKDAGGFEKFESAFFGDFEPVVGDDDCAGLFEFLWDRAVPAQHERAVLKQDAFEQVGILRS